MKKIISFLLITALLLSACTNSNDKSPQSKDVIKIGIVTPLTGNVATYGQSHLKGMQLAAKEVNSSGGVDGKMIELVTYDDGGVPTQAATGAQKLSDQKDILLISGSCTSSSTLAMVPITDKAKIPHMVVSSSAASLDGASPYFNRMASLDALVGGDMVTVAAERLNAKKGVIVYANTDSGKALNTSISANCKEKNIQVAESIPYMEKDQDFASIITKIKDLNPDVIFLGGYYTDSALLVKQARQQDITIPCIGSVSIYSPKYVEIGGESAEGTILLAPFLATSPLPKVQEFVKKYSEEYGTEPDSYAALAYDQLYVICDAVKRATEQNNGQLTREAMKDAVRSTNYEGVTGTVTFNDLGNWVRPFLVTVVKDGKFYLYE